MKILSLNTHSWLEENQLEKINVLVKHIVDLDYDLICLQEVNQTIESTETSHPMWISPKGERYHVPLKYDNYARIVVDKLSEHGLDYYWTWAASHTSYGLYDEGLAILAKKPFIANVQLLHPEIPYGPKLSRINLSATFEKLFVLNTHFSWWSPTEKINFQDEWLKTLSLNHNFSSSPAIVVGDFNQESQITGEGYSLVKSTVPFLSDSFEVAKRTYGNKTVFGEIAGWDQSNSEKRIDYIWTTPDITVNKHRVVFDGRETPIISDHAGIEVYLSWEESQATETIPGL